MAVLDVKSISIVFGGLKAVTNFSLKLEKNELVGLIGPNGAGKTTVFNMLTGVYNPTGGDILFNTREDGEHYKSKDGQHYKSEDGQHYKSIVGRKPYQITQMGIGRTFQNIRLFKNLSVLDNVRIAYHFNSGYNAFQGIFRTPAFYRKEEEIREKSLELLKIFNIQDKADEIASNLPYGEQRKLEITRALATNPKLLLLDEPAAGMNPQETHDLMNLIHFIREKFNLTILLIEHDMNLVMGICERISVLDYGQTIAIGTPSEISRDPKVIKAYLGDGGELGA